MINDFQSVRPNEGSDAFFHSSKMDSSSARPIFHNSIGLYLQPGMDDEMEWNEMRFSGTNLARY